MKDHQPNYCPELWQRLYLHQSNKTFVAKPCCYFQETERALWISDQNHIFEIYNNHPKTQAIRDENQQGKLGSGCRVCNHAEQAGMESGRTAALKRLTATDQVRPIKHLDLNLGSLCNLACAICDPHSSTSWVPIYQRMNERSWSYPLYDKKNRPIIDDPDLFQNLDTIQLQGGEVFLQNAYVDFFRNLSRARDLNEISVVIFSNGTVLPSSDFWHMLEQCRHVDLYFSIDDQGQRFEYQRYGANWSRTLDNIRWFERHAGSNFNLGFHPTYSLLNVFYLGDLQRFLSREFPKFERRWGPYHLGTGPCIADAMSAGARQAIIDRHHGISELTFLENYIRAEPRDLSDFWRYIERYDLATNGSFKDTHSEMHDLLRAS